MLGRYVRERKALTLAQAINKMTALPASRIHLADRGRIAPSMAADVVVFDPAKVHDTATYEEPFQYPVGINAVIVNGVVALRDGQRSHGSIRAGLDEQDRRASARQGQEQSNRKSSPLELPRKRSGAQ